MHLGCFCESNLHVEMVDNLHTSDDTQTVQDFVTFSNTGCRSDKKFPTLGQPLEFLIPPRKREPRFLRLVTIY